MAISPVKELYVLYSQPNILQRMKKKKPRAKKKPRVRKKLRVREKPRKSLKTIKLEDEDFKMMYHWAQKDALQWNPKLQLLSLFLTELKLQKLMLIHNVSTTALTTE